MEIYENINEPDWRSQCKLLSKQSSKNCGLSHTVYVDKFSSTIDSALFQLSLDERIPLLEIAREWDYATPQEHHDEQIVLKTTAHTPQLAAIGLFI